MDIANNNIDNKNIQEQSGQNTTQPIQSPQRQQSRKEPAPAIKGKTIGTIDAAPSGPSFLKISTPSNISMAITKITSAPAMANEEIST